MQQPEQVPEGFERHLRQSPVTNPWEPLWSRQDEDGLTIGFHVREAHCNARGLLHGGVTSSLADNAMGLACADASDGARGLLTVHLSVDYLGSATVGQWVEVRARPRRVGGSLAHAHGEVLADGETVATASAVFKVVRAKG